MAHSHPARGTAAPSPRRNEIADLQSVMRLIEDRLADIAAAIPERNRPLVSNALLNLAIERILAAEGPALTGEMLHRLADLIRAGEKPEGDDAFRLTGYDA
jgi:hypothetical protein